MVLFGCRNGWVYNLRATDGELVWSYRAAPADDQIVSYNQLESVWPVHGSVLVVDDVVYAAAGRNSYLDGGIHLVGLDVATGKKLHEGRVQHRPQDPAIDRGAAHDMVGAKNDVLASDGRHIFMQSVVFDMKLGQVPDGSQQSSHIYASAGYLDDQAWNRNAWRYSSTWPTVSKTALAVPHTGQLLVHDHSVTYGVKYFLVKTGQSMVFYPGERGYYLFANAVATGEPKKRANAKRAKRAVGDRPKTPPAKWDAWVPVRVRAMVKTADTLFYAGPPDVVDPNDRLAAFEGRKGAVLRVVSVDDGKQLAELRLDSPPVFDGMVAAYESLYLSLRDGSIACFAGQ
jgi:outer membrane protein assembly factor BamB